MANIFISYNREDEDRTKALVDDIEELGHTVWFDHELTGGQKWWDTILESVRNCDILVFALSIESLNSSACNLEYDYASKLGKTILPVLVGEGVSINLLPPVLSQIQFVDYRDPDRDALLHLAKALTSAPPSQPLPDPLPLPPEVPISYLGKLGKQIRNTSKLSYEEQSALLVDLKRGLYDPETAADTRTLLKKLRKRQYIFENIASEIDELLKTETQETRVTSNEEEASISEIQRKPQNETISSNTPSNEGSNTGYSGKMILFVTVLLIVLGIAAYFYFKQQEDKIFYVCYDEKLDNRHVDENQIFYKGCKSYDTDCASSGKEHFGGYLSQKDRDKALQRCINGTPRSVPDASQSNEDVSTLLKRAKAYFYGTSSIQVDYVKSREHFLKAAKLNSMDAYRYLGTMYLFGKGVAVNKGEAKRWLQMAINLGDTRAKEIYGTYIGLSEIAKEKVISFSENGIDIHITYPSHVRAGQKFKVTAKMTNNNSRAKQGGLTLSFPDMKSIPGRSVYNDFSRVEGYSYPQKIWNAQARKPLTAKYFMLEGWQSQLWRYGRTKSFSVELTAPSGLDELKVNLRGILWIKNKNDTRKIPLSSYLYDQQGYAVKQFSIKIKR